MRNIISYFIKYHVTVNIVIISFVIFGIIGALSMKSSFFPLIDSKNISINLVYPGASPQEMEEGVVLKIEENLKGIIGVDRVTSVSRENSANINVEILRGAKIDVVLAEVKNAVDRVPSFPTGMEPPVVSKIENLRETIRFSLTGTDIPLATLKNYARSIENDLLRINGISQVSIIGFPDQEIEIAVRETDLRAYNLSFEMVANAVKQSNILITGGNIKTDAEDFLIRANNRKYYGDELDNIVVRADKNGNIIRLKDVAEIKDTWSEVPDRVYYNGKKALEISVRNTNNEDLIETAENVRNYIAKFNQQHKNVTLEVTSDASITLGQRTFLLLKNIFFGVLLVLLFLAVFLNLRLAFWVAAGMPISFLGMFMMAAQLDITINVFSLFGMIIVIGILVDDGIVIGENIFNQYEKGKSPLRAAIDGTMEVVAPVFSAILTTIIAFSTFYFLDGRMGDMFSEVGSIVIITLAVSLLEALMILPAHLAHSGALTSSEKQNGFSRIFAKINIKADNFLSFIKDKLYKPYLTFFLKHRFLGIAIPLSMLIISIGAINGRVVRTSFFPSIASDRITVSLQMPNGTNDNITDSIISYIEEIAWDVNDEYTKKQTDNIPVVKNIIKRIGPGSSNATLHINLLEGEFRDFSSPEITKTLREKTGNIYEAEALLFSSGGNFGGSPVSVSLLGNNFEELKAAKQELKKIMQQNPKLKDVADNDPDGIKEINIKLKQSAYLMGLNLQSVMAQVRAAFFGLQAQRFQRGRDEIKVWVRYTKDNRSSIKNIDDMRIITPSGNRVPFSEIAEYEIARGDVAVNHIDGKREIQVSADLHSLNDSPTEILQDIRDNILPSIIAKYPSVSFAFEGQNREAKKTQNSISGVGLVIIILIYVVIAFAFRSYSQPLMLIIMIPFSLIGVVWGHYMHGFPISIMSWLGIIALVGIMVNDGLVLVGKFNGLLKEGLKFDDALIKAGASRFRAIFLTTVTTFAGLAPLLFEKSRQAQFLKPMAVSISYGIIIATFLTLLMLPLLLSLTNSAKVYVKWLRTGEKVNKEEVERAVIELKSENEDE